jgi:hypothetical protein
VVVPAWRRHLLIVKHRLGLSGRHPTLSLTRSWTRAEDRVR